MANLIDMISQLAQTPLNVVDAYNKGVQTRRGEEDRQLQRQQLIQQIEGMIQDTRRKKAEATLQEEELLPEAVSARSKKRQADIVKSEADIEFTKPERMLDIAGKQQQIRTSKAQEASSYASIEANKIRSEINRIELQNKKLEYALASDPTNINALRLKQQNDLKAEQLRGLYMEQLAAAEVKKKEAEAEEAAAKSSGIDVTPSGKEKDFEFFKRVNNQLGLGLPDELLFKVSSGAIEEVVDPRTGDKILVDVFDAFNPRKLSSKEANRVEYVTKATGTGLPTRIPGRVVVGAGTNIGDKVREEAKNFSRIIHQSEMPAAWNLVNKTISDIEEKSDLPGFGLTGNVPFQLLSEEGKALRQQVQTLFNITLKDRSGAAVTNPELQRLKIEFGTGNFKTDQDLIRGLKNFREALKSEIDNIVAGTSLPALLAYGASGGSDVIMQSSRLTDVEKSILAASRKNPNMTLDEIISEGKKLGIVPKDYALSKFLE